MRVSIQHNTSFSGNLNHDNSHPYRGYPLSAEAKDMIKACKEATKDKGTDWFVEPVGKSSGGIS
eukprot:1317650-Amorphochlora_amoeboformis.AAC.1